jgi:hypothetical protein
MANPDAGTGDDRLPPPGVTINAARQHEAEMGRGRPRQQDERIGASVIGGVVGIGLAALSFILLWLSS